MDPSNEQPDTLPPAIASRLRSLDRAEAIFDPRTDRAVLEAARSYFAARPAPATRSSMSFPRRRRLKRSRSMPRWLRCRPSGARC